MNVKAMNKLEKAFQSSLQFLCTSLQRTTNITMNEQLTSWLTRYLLVFTIDQLPITLPMTLFHGHFRPAIPSHHLHHREVSSKQSRTTNVSQEMLFVAYISCLREYLGSQIEVDAHINCWRLCQVFDGLKLTQLPLIQPHDLRPSVSYESNLSNQLEHIQFLFKSNNDDPNCETNIFDSTANLFTQNLTENDQFILHNRWRRIDYFIELDKAFLISLSSYLFEFVFQIINIEKDEAVTEEEIVDDKNDRLNLLIVEEIISLFKLIVSQSTAASFVTLFT
jgi:hypothetical protein